MLLYFLSGGQPGVLHFPRYPLSGALLLTRLSILITHSTHWLFTLCPQLTYRSYGFQWRYSTHIA